MTAFTIDVPDALAEKLDRLAEKMDRPRDLVAAQAIADFVAREAAHLAEIEAGLVDADRGDFASAEDLSRVIGRYLKPAA